jgi:hypothetical protein
MMASGRDELQACVLARLMGATAGAGHGPRPDLAVEQSLDTLTADLLF